MIRPDTPDHGKKLFTFAVISDTHVNPEEDRCNSPFPVNARANRRFRHIVADLNQRDIEFVMHLGDLVHPVPETGDAYRKAAEVFDSISANLRVPMHVLPGNHDIGDTPISGAPASSTTPAMIAAWKDSFGDQYSSLEWQGVTFILFNAQLINSGLAEEDEQRQWVEETLAAAPGRVMLMFHHPAYLCHPDEEPHYDNTDPPGRDWLLDLARNLKVEAMFAGHAHNFWYDRVNDTDYYLAPATSFVRQDYSEMLRTPPPEGAEFGRDDRGKLGYFIVTVYEYGHSLQVVRTDGAELGPDDPAGDAVPIGLTPRQNPAPVIGFDLRSNWAELSEVPPSGGLDEFERKTVRNDYPLLALIEMGVRDIRIPVSDLRDPERRKRLQTLCHLGFRPTLFSYGAPQDAAINLVAGARDLIRDWEITIKWENLEDSRAGFKRAHDQTGLPLYLSRMRSKGDLVAGAVYFHVINHGFFPDEDEKFDLLAAQKSEGVVGAVLRLSDTDPAADGVAQMAAAMQQRSMKLSVHLKCATSNPALPATDRSLLQTRLANAIEQTGKFENTRVFCDTLLDVDRGYFVRKGVYDCWGNATETSRMIATLHSAG